MKKPITVILAGVFAAVAVHATDVKENWEKNCVKCHGADGKGNTKQGKKVGIVNLTDPKVQEKYTDEEIFKRLKEGVNDDEGRVRMKAVEGLTDAEIKALIRYVRTLKAK
jgi:cytochrome c553